MNSRIKELMPVQGVSQGWQGDDGSMSSGKVVHYYSEDQMLQLAESIVKECARISNEADDTMTNQGAASAQAFMEHFGVEK